MLLRVNPDNPQSAGIHRAVECLKNGGVIIYPTDTVYGIGCDIHQPKAIERICKIKGIDPQKANLTFICHDLSHISDYAKHIDNTVFKLMKKSLPGPFTFILEASNNVPKLLRNNKKTVGIRVPDNPICKELLQWLGNPILSTSVHDDDDLMEYITDPEEIHSKYENLVDVVIDGGFGHNVASTVIDCTGDEPFVIRQGAGEI